jgi:PAS domain S-box-containing protein
MSRSKNRSGRRSGRSDGTATTPPPTDAGAAGDAAEQLRLHEHLHRLACEAGRTGSWYVPLDTQDCVLSAMAAQLLGLPAREIVLPADVWRKRVDPGHLAGLETKVRAAVKEDVAFDWEFRANRPDGTEYWLYARGRSVRDSEGKPIRIHGALVDLTEHKKAKDELKQLNETLEQRVAERTAALVEAQDALRQAQKVEAMGRLTGGMAHDFNNLLTPIIATLDELQRAGIRNEREARLIAGALKSADSARLLVQRLLAFARRQPLQPVRVDVGALVNGMIDMIGRTIGPQIRIRVDLGEDLKPSFADPNQLEMAILNLSVNARDAMPYGGELTIAAVNKEVKASDQSSLEPGAYVRLSVTDTGAGMDEETRLRAVEPFFSTKESGEGTGLGLSMAHGLASQLGGALILSSAPGRGTQVELWLPVWTGGPHLVPAPDMPATGHQSGGRALLVDDHDLVRMTTSEMLRELGYDVVEAGSAEEAIRLVAKGLRVDLVVSDHLMTGITGADLARLLRSRWPQTPFLLMSGAQGAEGIAADLPCLAKPFRKADLQAAIAAATGPRQHRGTVPERGADSDKVVELKNHNGNNKVDTFTR